MQPAPHFQSPGPPLDVFFAPRTIALIGATESQGSVGRSVMENLLCNPAGPRVFPVNPKRSQVLGVPAYPSIARVGQVVDLAVIVTPATTVPEVISECVGAGIKGAVIISAGFKETGVTGMALERQILGLSRKAGMRIVGPNCLGIMSPWAGLNATFASTMARPGNVGFISQSGALCTAILDWSLKEMVGFSAFVSTGSMLDVGWGDLISYLGEDPRTKSIVLYMETIGDARSFMSAAREVALRKPIIIIKAGRTGEAAKAAASHTGSLAGSDEALDAAFRRCGVLRVDRISDLFYMAEVLAKQPRPDGPRLAILTNAGGPGVLATDALISEGGQLAQLSEGTLDALNSILPAHWSHQNPVDILGDADAARYAKAIEIVAQDKNSDGVLVILTPQGMTASSDVAEKIKPHAKLNHKPILASWMGGVEVASGESILNRAGIPTFSYPDTAARAFQYMWRYTENLRGLYETPVASANSNGTDLVAARLAIDQAYDANRTVLTEPESKSLLAAYGIPVVDTRIAHSEEEATEFARKIGYPVVVKLYSATITHKTDVGGVVLDLKNGEAVRAAWRAIESSVAERRGREHFNGVTVQPMIRGGGYEIILGSSPDSQLGPVILFGAGGELVEVFRDRALGLPPLNTTFARRLMERTRIYTALKGVRGRKPVDLAALEDLVVRFSQLVIDSPRIKEIDINPLLVSEERIMALDARVIVYPLETKDEDLPRTAIRPYPSQYASDWQMRDGSAVHIRPIRPEDEPRMVRFHETLSERSVYLRYFHLINLNQRISHERLARICFVDYDREMALIVERTAPQHTGPEIIAVGRLTRRPYLGEAEFALLIGDEFQGQGLGTELLKRLIGFARDEKIERVTGYILPENHSMQEVAHNLGFDLRDDPQEGALVAEIRLTP